MGSTLESTTSLSADDPRLTALDRAAARPLVEVVAAHGWGKTSLVGTWARRRSIAVLSLESADRAPARLGARLVEALTAGRASSTPPDLGSAAAHAAPLDLIAARIVAAADDPPSRVVLDDADVLRGSASVALLRAVLSVPGARIRLLVNSREELGLIDATTAARGDAHRWGARELRLAPGAIAAAVERAVPELDPRARASLCAAVASHTDGWPAGVAACGRILASDALRASGDPAAVGLDLLLRDPALLAVVDQVLLAPEPPEVLHLLTEVALLGRVDAGALAAVQDVAVGEMRRRLGALVRRGLLVGRRPGERDSVEVAPLVRRALLGRLHGDAFATAALEEVVSGLGRSHGSGIGLPKLLEALVDAGAQERLLSVLTDRWSQVEALPAAQRSRAIEAIDVAARPPWLVLGHADALAAQGLIVAALAALDRLDAASAEVVIRRVRILADLGRWAEVLRTEADVADLAGDAEAAHRALPSVIEAELAAHAARAHLARGAREAAGDALIRSTSALEHHAADGDRDRAAEVVVRRERARWYAAADEQTYRQAHREAFAAAESAEDDRAVARIRLLHARHHLFEGRTTEALFELDRAEALLPPATALPEAREAAVVRSLVLLRTGRLDRAARAAQRALDLVEDPGATPARGEALLRLADVARERGERATALARYAEAGDAVADAEDRAVLDGVAVGRARIEADRTAALAWLEDVLAGERVAPAVDLAAAWLSLELGDDHAVTRHLARAGRTGDHRVHAEVATLEALRAPDPLRALDDAARRWHRLQDPVWAARVELGRARRTADADARSRIVDLEARLARHGVHLEVGDVAHEVVTGARMPPRLAVRVLGGLRVRRDGEDVPLTGFEHPQLDAAIALLALRAPRSVAREELAAFVQLDADPERDVDTLIGCVRSVLTSDDGRLVGVSGTRTAVSLRVGAVALDLDLFRRRVEAAARALTRDELRAARVLLEGARHVDRGALLEGGPTPAGAVEVAMELTALRGRVEALERATAQALGSIGDGVDQGGPR
ncbi:MAG: hypothetical protein JJT89_11660 [Nitriliruptoraceae bacterium]|nr:hypothetical protein [Nitriliruptoraceae bacterium]